MVTRWVVGALTVLTLSGCGASQTQASSTMPASAREATDYAQALGVAFERYAQAVAVASSLQYASEAEVEAVQRSLSAERFDYELKEALGERGLTVGGLARFAEANPAFFHSQQQLYWGKYQALRERVSSLPARVQRAPQDSALLAQGQDPAR